MLLLNLMADVALAGLVKEGVSGVSCVARDLLPAAVLALDAVATQMAPLDAGLAALDPGHLGDLGQSAGLGGGAAAHPGGHGAVAHGGGCQFGHPATEGEGRQGRQRRRRRAATATDGRCFSPHAAGQADDALLSHHGQVAVGDHGQVVGGNIHRHAGMLDEQVLHRAGLCRGSLCSETGGRGDKPALIHAASL